MFGFGFNARNCRLSCMQGANRIKLVRNKKVNELAATEKSVADFLTEGKDEMAMMRVEQVIRLEQYLKALELLDVFLEMIRTRVDQMARQKEMPDDMYTSLFSVAFASHRVTDVPELRDLRKQLEGKYGGRVMQQVAGSAPEVSCRVSAPLVAYLSVDPPDFETKLKCARAISLKHRKEDLDDAKMREAMGEYAALAPSGSPLAHAAPSNQIVDLPVPGGAQPVSLFDAHQDYMSQVVEQPYHEPPGSALCAPTVPSESGVAGQPYVPPPAEYPGAYGAEASYTGAMAKAQSGAHAPDLPYLDSTNSDNEFYAGKHVPAHIHIGGGLPTPPPCVSGGAADQTSWYPGGSQAVTSLPDVPKTSLKEEGPALQSHDFPKAPANEAGAMPKEMPTAPSFSHSGVVYEVPPASGDDTSVQSDLLERLKRLHQ